MKSQPYPLAVRVYFHSRKILNRIFYFIDGCCVGFWLGVLGRNTLHTVDKYYYNNENIYQNEAHNRRGLWEWEKEALKGYFQGCTSVLVGGVGGGREALALGQLGYTVDGFECNPTLVAFANQLLESEGYRPAIECLPPDQCPEGAKRYDGIIMGWGAYMLIQGSEHRIAFLKKLRAQIRDQGPILLSFFHRSGKSRRFTVITTVGNTIRWLLRRETRLTFGDDLAPNYVHHFTREEIAAELREGGFELTFYSSASYGHAVGIAS